MEVIGSVNQCLLNTSLGCLLDGGITPTWNPWTMTGTLYNFVSRINVVGFNAICIILVRQPMGYIDTSVIMEIKAMQLSLSYHHVII